MFKPLLFLFSLILLIFPYLYGESNTFYMAGDKPLNIEVIKEFDYFSLFGLFLEYRYKFRIDFIEYDIAAIHISNTDIYYLADKNNSNFEEIEAQSFSGSDFYKNYGSDFDQLAKLHLEFRKGIFAKDDIGYEFGFINDSLILAAALCLANSFSQKDNFYLTAGLGILTFDIIFNYNFYNNQGNDEKRFKAFADKINQISN